MTRATLADLISARRILVVGVAGSGKTTAACKLAARLRQHGLDSRMIDADADLRWLPADVHGPWAARPIVEQRAMAAQLAAGECWVHAGVGSPVEEVFLPRVELVIALDYPDRVTGWRLLRRTSLRIITRAREVAGNRETLREALGPDSVLRWWNATRAEHHEHALAWEEGPTPTLRLTHPRQLARVLEAVSGHD